MSKAASLRLSYLRSQIAKMSSVERKMCETWLEESCFTCGRTGLETGRYHVPVEARFYCLRCYGERQEKVKGVSIEEGEAAIETLSEERLKSSREGDILRPLYQVCLNRIRREFSPASCRERARIHDR